VNKENIMQFEYRVAGIPAIINVTALDVRRSGMYNNVVSEFEVCDRRGRYAAWLERKLDDDMIADIKYEIAQRA
jgi:hypothetical protein